MPDRADLDAILDRGEPADAAPESTPEPEAPAAETPPETEAAPADPFDSGADTFPRDYVEKLRRENQTYRQRAKSYDDAFEGYDDNSRQFIMEWAKELRVSPQVAAQKMQAELEAILTPAEQQQHDNQTGEAPLTAADVQRILDERDQRASADQRLQQEQQAVEGIFDQAHNLGYKDNSVEMILLLHTAKEQGITIQEAHDSLDGLKKSERQKVIDEYLSQKASDSDNTPNTRTPGGSAPSGEKKITSIKDATAALKASNLLAR